MIPTAWSVFFDSDQVSPEVARRVHDSRPMEVLRAKLRGYGDSSSALAADTAVEQAIREVLDVSLLEVLKSAWRRHPELAATRPGLHDEDGFVLFGLGEHEVVSTHRPRIDVVGPNGTLSSFQFELRLELKVQSATLWIENGSHPARATIGACSGSGSLSLADQELIASGRDSIRFPDDVSLDEPSA